MHNGGADGAVNIKSGRHSRYLPADMDRLYQDAISNPELLEMTDHIALLDARIISILRTSTEGNPVPRWSDLADTFAQLETALLSGELDKSVPAMEQVHRILDAGKAWDRTWAEIVTTMEQLRKVADTEIKRKKELNQMVPIERVVVLMAAVATAVKRNVSNPDEIAGVYRELALLHGTNAVPGNPSVQRAGPEFVLVSKDKKGSKGGTSREALRNKKVKQYRQRLALESTAEAEIVKAIDKEDTEDVDAPTT